MTVPAHLLLYFHDSVVFGINTKLFQSSITYIKSVSGGGGEELLPSFGQGETTCIALIPKKQDFDTGGLVGVGGWVDVGGKGG